MHTPQHSIASGFHAASTSADVIAGIDLRGKVAIVTGGHSGLGRETVRIFKGAGARVIVPVRDIERATAALGEIDGVELMQMDLLDPDSIDAFGAAFLATGSPLHILVNSAGIMALPALSVDARGYELQFATNHLGHFQLVARLWPALLQAQAARVVSVSSLGHRFSPVVMEDPHFKQRPYDRWLAYGQSKTANALFAVELDRRGKAFGVRAFAAHPGAVPGTGLGQHVDIEVLKAAGVVDADGNPIVDPAKGVKNIEQGAATQIWCATSAQLAGMGGVYCENADIAHIAAASGGNFELSHKEKSDSNAGVQAYAVDTELAKRLWALSEDMSNVRYG